MRSVRGIAHVARVITNIEIFYLHESPLVAKQKQNNKKKKQKVKEKERKKSIMHK